MKNCKKKHLNDKDTGVFLDCKNLKKSSTFINMLSFILPVVTILSAIMFFFDIYPQITAISALVSAAVSFVLCCIINSVNGGLLRELEMIKNRIYSYYEVINEIARIASGDITINSINHAKELRKAV